jgi:hypothetical protein
MSSSINSGHSTSTAIQSYLSNSSYTPQQSNYYVNSSPLNINNPRIFRFEIPGFEIVVIPTTPTTSFSNSANLNMQNQFQQDQTQFQQQQQNSRGVNGSFINFNNFRG